VILVVQGDVLVRTRLAESLRVGGYKVAEVSNTADAGRVLSAGVEVDLVICEHVMPHGGSLSGSMFAVWVQVHHPDMPVVIVAEPTEELRASAANNEHLRFVTKAYRLEHLAQVVREMMPAA
jgi:DNA-binding NtrC family response regulator